MSGLKREPKSIFFIRSYLKSVRTIIFYLSAIFLFVCGSVTQAASVSSISSTSFTSSSLASISSSKQSSINSSLASSVSSVVYSNLKVRVNGLNIGKTLILKNNGGDPLSITRNASYFYLFPQALSNGSSFSVTVASKPAEQNCSVFPATGTVGAANAEMIFVTCSNIETASTQVSTEGYPAQPLQVPLGNIGIRNKAYPNILYESRIGVNGGVFPYEFRIAGLTKNGQAISPSGVSIDFRKGILRWLPAEVGNYVVTVKIKDSRASTFTGSAEITQAFPIEVTTAKFSFVDIKSGVDAVSSGSINSPYKTIKYALTNAPLANTVYLRKGFFPAREISLNNSTPAELLAYPNERVIVDNEFRNINVSESTRVVRVEGFDFINMRQWGFHVDPAWIGLVIRNNRFINGREYKNGEAGDVGTAENPGFIFTRSDSYTRHNNILVQDNYFGPFIIRSWINGGDGTVRTSGGAAATFFDVKNAIVENNFLETETENGFNDKDNTQFNTYRENTILKASGQTVHLMGQYGARGAYVHHNLLIGSGVVVGTQCGSDCGMEDIYIHHNTLIDGGIGWSWGLFNATSKNFQVHRNVISNTKGAPHQICQDRDLTSAFAQTKIDRNLYVKPPLLIMNNDWCPEYNDADKSKWQNMLGFDLNGIFTTTSPLTGSSTMIQLRSDSPYYLLYGHIY